MKKKLLTRANALLSAAIVTLMGLCGCEGPMVKYGPAPDEMYGPPAETVPMYGVTPPDMTETNDSIPQTDTSE